MGKQEKMLKAQAEYADYVMSYLNEEAQAAVNEAGLELLRRFGFDTEGFLESEKARAFLAAEMLKKRTSLCHVVEPCEEKKSNIIYFELIKNGRVVGRISARRVEELSTVDAESRTSYEKLYPGYTLSQAKGYYNPENGGYYLIVTMRIRNEKCKMKN